MRYKTKMNTKKLLVSLVAIASLFLLATVSAASDITYYYDVEVDGIYTADTWGQWNEPAVVAGENIIVEVTFTANVSDTDVTIEAELEGEKVSFDAISAPFDVEAGKVYKKKLVLKVPYELKDELSDELTLNIEIDGKEAEAELNEITLRVQRPSYNAEVKSITVSQTVEAGETIPVDIVLKNRGYNDLDDIYVTARIAELGVEQTSYFGDLVAIEKCATACDEDEEDTVSGRLYLKVPYDVEAGIYTVEVTVENEDTENTVVKQVVVENDFSNSVIVTSSSKTVAAGQEAVYDLLIVNPTNKLKVYRVITESSSDVASSAEMAVVAVPAGSSKAVKISATANTEGAYNFNVNVLSGDTAVETVALTLNVEGNRTVSNPVVVLTIILAVIFLVLLIVLIVLLGKKPSQSEEFGESYY
jgi:hypothetical protein